MRKITTSEKTTNLLNEKKIQKVAHEMQPSAESLKKILQFAFTYRAQQIGDNQHVEFYLN